ncbi:MAG: HlyD family efflux transporter periplasmic adaptor subunit [Gemmatales bacterium]
MRFRAFLSRAAATAVILLALGASAYFTRASWLTWLNKVMPVSTAPANAAKENHDEHDHSHDDGNRVKLSEQAQKNLKLLVEPIVPESYSRTIIIPGMVVDRPGLSDRAVISPVAGVITAVNIQPGDTLKPGEGMFKVRLLSEVFQQSQSELFKAAKDLQLNKENISRLRAIGSDAIPQARVIELENQERRLQASITAYRQELLTRGLSQEQIDSVAAGKFITEIAIPTPTITDAQGVSMPVNGRKSTEQIAYPTIPDAQGNSTPGLPPPPDPTPPMYEVKEVRVQVGEQVQAGQALCILANHRVLYIEGRAFKQESGLLEKAAQQSWQVKAEFAEESNGWPASESNLQIRHLANTVDPVSRTFAFFIPIANQSRSFGKDGRNYLVWRFRPGQRARLHVPVEQFEDVFVLPASAVVREGAEVYAFRQNGNTFERRPVHLLLEDRETVLIANDGSLGAGQFIVRNGAAALNRALKAKAASGGGHEGHDHAH